MTPFIVRQTYALPSRRQDFVTSFIVRQTCALPSRRQDFMAPFHGALRQDFVTFFLDASLPFRASFISFVPTSDPRVPFIGLRHQRLRDVFHRVLAFSVPVGTPSGGRVRSLAAVMGLRSLYS